MCPGVSDIVFGTFEDLIEIALNDSSAFAAATGEFLKNEEEVATERRHENINEHNDSDGASHIDKPVACEVAIVSVKYIITNDWDLSEGSSYEGLREIPIDY